jgi:hypothetical protein
MQIPSIYKQNIILSAAVSGEVIGRRGDRSSKKMSMKIKSTGRRGDRGGNK